MIFLKKKRNFNYFFEIFFLLAARSLSDKSVRRDVAQTKGNYYFFRKLIFKNVFSLFKNENLFF